MSTRINQKDIKYIQIPLDKTWKICNYYGIEIERDCDYFRVKLSNSGVIFVPKKHENIL